MARTGMKSSIAVFAGLLLILMIPFAMVTANSYLIGQQEVNYTADNLIDNPNASYTEPVYVYDNGSGEQTDSLGWTNDNGTFTITVGNVTVSDTTADTVRIAVDLTARDIIDKSILSISSDLETLDNYDNLIYKMNMEGSSGTVTLNSKDNVDGYDFEMTENIDALEAYDIRDQIGDNGALTIILKTPIGDNQDLSGESLTFEAKGYDSANVISATHESIWQISMVLMGLFGFLGAIVATPYVDILQ